MSSLRHFSLAVDGGRCLVFRALVRSGNMASSSGGWLDRTRNIDGAGSAPEIGKQVGSLGRREMLA